MDRGRAGTEVELTLEWDASHLNQPVPVEIHFLHEDVQKNGGKDVPHVAMHAHQRSSHEIQGCRLGLSLYLVLVPIHFNWMKERNVKTLKVLALKDSER